MNATAGKETMGELTKLLIRVEPRLKGRIARRVEREGRNMNDVLVQMLAEHYGLPFEATGRRGGLPVGPTPAIMLYLPAELRDAIDFDAKTAGESARNTVVRIICDKLGVAFKPTGRWAGKRRRAATT